RGEAEVLFYETIHEIGRTAASSGSKRCGAGPVSTRYHRQVSPLRCRRFLGHQKGERWGFSYICTARPPMPPSSKKAAIEEEMRRLRLCERRWRKPASSSPTASG